MSLLGATQTAISLLTSYLLAVLHVFTALRGMQSQSSDENSARLSVCLSVYVSVKRVDCVKAEEKYVKTFISYERSFSRVFWVGATLLPESLGQPTPVGAKSLILNRYSLVARNT